MTIKQKLGAPIKFKKAKIPSKKNLNGKYVVLEPINITSPTGLKNFKDLTGVDLAVDFWNFLEKR